MSEDARGNKVARAVWDRIQEAKSVELVPWVANPKSDRYDAEQVAEHCGFKRAMAQIEDVMREASA